MFYLMKVIIGCFNFRLKKFLLLLHCCCLQPKIVRLTVFEVVKVVVLDYPCPLKVDLYCLMS